MGGTKTGWGRDAGSNADLDPWPLSILALHGKTVLAVSAQPDAEMLLAMRPKAPPHGTQGWRLSWCHRKGVKTQEGKKECRLDSWSCSVQV